MRKMKKVIGLTLAAAMMASSLAGCGGGSKETPKASETPAVQSSAEAKTEGSGEQATETEDITLKQPEGEFVCTPEFIGWEKAEIEISWQPNPSHSMDSGSESKTNYIIERASEWVKAHPNVKIRVVGTTNNINDNMAKLRLEVVEGTQSDVVAVDSFMVNMFKDYAQPLNDAMERNGIALDEFFPFIQDTMTNENGDVICIQYTTDVRSLFYRKDWIDTPPATVAELMEVGKKMVEEGHDGMITAAGRNETVVNNHLGLYWSQGVDLVNEDGTIAFADGKGKEAMLNYLKYFEDLVKSGIMPSRVVDYTSDKNTYAEIAAGNVAMAVEASSAVAQLQEVMGKEAFDEVWAIAPLPVFNAGDQATSSAGGWTNMVFTKDELKKQLAADFVIYLYSDDDGTVGWCEAGGYFPTRERIFRECEPFKSDSYAQTFADYLEVASKRPSTDIYTVISSELQIAIGEIITGAKTAEDALEDVIEAVQNN